MITLHFAPLTRPIRIMWLLEELGLDYTLQHVAFRPADVMIGFTIWSAKMLGPLTEAHPKTLAYYRSLAARPAFAKALAESRLRA